MEGLDVFVRRCDQEVKAETAEGRSSCRKHLEWLRAEEAGHVRANDSPEQNPAFGKVREDLAKTLAQLEEHDGRDAARAAFLTGWEAVVEGMPEAGRARALAMVPAQTKRKWPWPFG